MPKKLDKIRKMIQTSKIILEEILIVNKIRSQKEKQTKIITIADNSEKPSIGLCSVGDNQSGMITVEMALVLPFIICILIAVMYLFFFVLDIAKVHCYIDQTMQYAGQAIGKSDSLTTGFFTIKERNEKKLYQLSHSKDEKKIRSLINKELKNRLMILKIKSVDVTILESTCKVKLIFSAKAKIWEHFQIRPYTISYCNCVEVGNYADKMRQKECIYRKKINYKAKK